MNQTKMLNESKLNNFSNLKLEKKPFVNNVALVSGLHYSGKSMLIPIITSLVRSEIIYKAFTLEHFQILNYLKKISYDSAVFLIRYNIDFALYDKIIGRNINFRFEDETSIWNAQNPSSYFKRLSSTRGDSIIDRINKENPIHVIDIHNGLWFSNLWFNAYPTLKMIHINRNPIDIVYDWYSNNFGSEFYLTKTNQLLLVNWENNIVPYYAIGWENEYINMNQMDRCISMVFHLEKHHKKSKESLTKKQLKNLFIVNFEEMVTNPEPILSKICLFLKTNVSLNTQNIMERERVPRIPNKKDYKNKLIKIKKLASKKSFDLLMRMIDNYKI